MQKELNQEVQDRLLKLSDMEFGLMIVEDSPEALKGILFVLKHFFPNAKVHAIMREEFQTIDEIIRKEQPHLVFLNGNLRDFGEHPVFGHYGPHLVPFILLESPGSLILSMSMERGANREALKKGAHGALLKDHLFAVFSEILGAK